MLEKATYGFVESTEAQLIALFQAWRQDIDSEPFAHEHEWAGVDAPRFRTFRHNSQPCACPGGPPSVS
ncbi:hypothetical protein [Actinophytocola sp. NPDC049390]|uniref:hypothetical protein n=1 Tax=Actinophytocola sp. NPDC049390 TaxID=3363894 RepID=UPI0037B6B408